MERRTTVEVLEDNVRLQGASVVDVGCGNGWLCRFMTKKGAHVTGVEVSPKQLAAARSVPPVGDEHYIQGIAEDLPIANRSVDVVVYCNSFHHVEKAGLTRAMREAARVLRLGGILYVTEPAPEGPYFELMKPVHDETEVRNNAEEALRHAPDCGLIQEKSIVHVDTVPMADFGAFHDRLTSINPAIRARFDEQDLELREAFVRLSREVPDGREFDQPMRVTVLRRG